MKSVQKAKMHLQVGLVLEVDGGDVVDEPVGCNVAVSRCATGLYKRDINHKSPHHDLAVAQCSSSVGALAPFKVPSKALWIPTCSPKPL